MGVLILVRTLNSSSKKQTEMEIEYYGYFISAYT